MGGLQVLFGDRSYIAQAGLELFVAQVGLEFLFLCLFPSAEITIYEHAPVPGYDLFKKRFFWGGQVLSMLSCCLGKHSVDRAGLKLLPLSPQCRD